MNTPLPSAWIAIIHRMLLLSVFSMMLLGCILPSRENGLNDAAPILTTSHPQQVTPAVAKLQTATLFPPNVTPPPTRQPGQPFIPPTPDQARILPTLRQSAETHVVSAGESLSSIAKRYGVTVAMLVAANDLADPNLLEVGQVLTIPVPVPGGTSPAHKLIPDSELVYGPMTIFFSIDDFINEKDGYLAHYRERVDGIEMTGANIVARVSREFSVNPRLLLALLEHQSGWLTSRQIEKIDQKYPLGLGDRNREGLWRQLTWAANQLNYGYYTWKANVLSAYFLPDGSVIIPSIELNAGSVGIQYFFSLLYDQEKWRKNVMPGGFIDTYQAFFGYPFDLAIEPLVPPGLEQPEMQLPFEPGVTWSFTGGPHGGWGDGSAWAALDFAPPGDAFGCVSSDAWVVASAPGLVVHSGDGVVIIDLDMDGFPQTGWTLLYLHIETKDRIENGVHVEAGDRLGHPSCEGGLSSGTHVHIARRYNGEWVEVTGSIPFVMDGWIVETTGDLYDGYLIKDGYVVEAWDSRKPENQIRR